MADAGAHQVTLEEMAKLDAERPLISFARNWLGPSYYEIEPAELARIRHQFGPVYVREGIEARPAQIDGRCSLQTTWGRNNTFYLVQWDGGRRGLWFEERWLAKARATGGVIDPCSQPLRTQRDGDDDDGEVVD